MPPESPLQFSRLSEVKKPPQVVVCPTCYKIYQKSRLLVDVYTCQCGFQFRFTAKNRIKTLVDPNTFNEWDGEIISKNPLNFPDYDKKLEKATVTSGVNEGVITGTGKIKGIDVVLAVMEPLFMMGSMGSAIGEKITRAIEQATHFKNAYYNFFGLGWCQNAGGCFVSYANGKDFGSPPKT